MTPPPGAEGSAGSAPAGSAPAGSSSAGRSGSATRDPSGPESAGRPARALRRLARLTAWRPGPRAQRVLLAVAAVVFLGGAWLAARGLDVAVADLGLGYLAVAVVVGVPLTIAANAAEYAVSARMVGHRAGAAEAARVSLLATAANLLPVPGAALVRIQALHAGGSRLRMATSATLAVALAWLGVGALAAGVWLIAGPRALFGGAMVAGGSLALAGAWLLLRTQVVEVASVATSALRLALALLALRGSATAAQALLLALSIVLASAIGFVPGGLGVREVAGALLAPLVALPAAVGFAALALDRIVGLVGSAPVALVVGWRAGRRPDPGAAGGG